ncbi:MAG: N-acetyltransferase family protein [Bacteroidota bacterium]
MIIRPAQPEDNPALCRMELMAPQGSAIRLTDRRFDFFTRARNFPGSELIVAADDKTGQLIGVLGGVQVKLRVGGRERLGGFLFDFRSNPEYRHGLGRTIYRLWREVEQRLLKAGTEFIYGLVKEDNPANSIYLRMGCKKLGARLFWTLPVYRRQPVPDGLAVRKHIDAAADYREAVQWYQGYDLWPVIPDPSILQPLLDRYLHAELSYEGATLKIWDGTLDYERIVTAGPRIYEVIRPVADAIRPLIPVPRIPRVGQPLRTWYLYDLRLPNGVRSLRPLLAAANNLALEHGVDFLIVSASAGEPELAPAGRGALVRLKYDLVIKEYEPVPEISDRFFLDIRTV